MKKIAFLTTVFPMKEEYLLDFFRSLSTQTYKNFHLIIVNDGFENLRFLIDQYKDLNISEIAGCSNIAKNRELGINYCIENSYDIIVFGDSDDYFQTNRVEKSLEFLEKGFDIVVNDLTLFNKNGVIESNYISSRVENNTEIEFFFIKDKNIFGLSNTAILLENMEKIKIPDDIDVVDWYLFSSLLLENKKAVFTNETVTFYRQYSNNLIGLKQLNEDSLKKGILVKKKHYLELQKMYKDEFFRSELSRLSNLEQNQFGIVKKRIKNPLWWELI